MDGMSASVEMKNEVTESSPTHEEMGPPVRLGVLDSRLGKLSVSPSLGSPRSQERQPASIFLDSVSTPIPHLPNRSVLTRHSSSPSLMEASPQLSPGGRRGMPSANNSPPSATREPQQSRFAGYDLTPVTRNTTGERYFDEDRDGFVVVTPGDTVERENLALPSAEQFSASNKQPLRRPPLRRRSGPSIPPFPISHRAKSVGSMILTEGQADNQPRDISNEDDKTGEPVQFPSRQKFFSFNSIHQFQGAVQQHDNLGYKRESSANPFLNPGLTPYQPSREDLGDVGKLPREELSRIFIPRTTATSSEASTLHPFPVEERQLSIPSIRLATHLNGSVTSHTDDEDDLRLFDDDSSWSSRGSSLCIPEEISEESPGGAMLKLGRPKPVVIEGDFDSNDTGACNDQDGAVRRKKRRGGAERRVFEWLRTVDAGDDVIAEAASSKFLTGGFPAQERGFGRQNSSPPTFRENATTSGF